MGNLLPNNTQSFAGLGTQFNSDSETLNSLYYTLAQFSPCGICKCLTALTQNGILLHVILWLWYTSRLLSSTGKPNLNSSHTKGTSIYSVRKICFSHDINFIMGPEKLECCCSACLSSIQCKRGSFRKEVSNPVLKIVSHLT